MSMFVMPPVPEMNGAEYPHGECECIHGSCPCSKKPGPAAFTVERDGKTMRVCTRCDLSRDRATEKLLVTDADDIQVYYKWDALGGCCIEMRLQRAKEAT